MALPLYRPAADAKPSRAADGNAGLWYDKFCDKWKVPGWTLQADRNDERDANPKLDWIATLTSHTHGRAAQLEESTTRLIRLSLRQGGLSLVFRTESRFVTGLGRSHPVENGFAWHPTLGTPYLPGSSIKGMVRAWAKQHADPKPDQDTLDRLFGAPAQAGQVCFLDAVPIAPVRVEADVLTPHYAGWSPADPPGDWKSPTPVPFLITAAGMRLLFTVVPCGALAEGDLENVETWLIESLTWAGAGAKTAVGYGRMVLEPEKSDELRQEEQRRSAAKLKAQHEQERLASMDPLDRELEEIAQAAPQTAPYRVWIKAVEDGRWQDQPAVERAVLQRIEATMRATPGGWKDISMKKNPDKDTEFKDTNRVKKLLAQNRDKPGAAG
ncbi:type III-B CRISPR module RAMP protein Cmr6 [Aphanothece minutissima]|uniref:Type III-B CRISPR module RAMP protein Cmr6 n=1 Tax=Aphanothece cf. minutissima CCALA 015 TaxID=2107695 RepID=A0ABX5FBY5_9CHRO|nr:type III-B CRISPR module RAMP protein Cmr6 [Aphanothece minutissima]PSB39446.1 type III-B CRISPR module RAMP protein Cmr6 [Aphanothece cf. minutissima CCALA 015]